MSDAVDAPDGDEDERRSGLERRDEPPELPPDHPNRGRPVYSRGPIIIGLIFLFLLTSIGSAAAVYFSINALSGRLDTIQVARERSAFDTCAIIGTVLSETESHGKTYIVHAKPGQGKVVGYLTVPNNHASTQRLLRGAKLTNCHRYSILVRTGKLQEFKPPHR